MQVKGIVNLVAHAVTGLTPSNVTLTDQTGVPLWKDNGAGGNALGDGQPGDENAKASETERKKLQGVLDEAFGPGKAIVMVNAELDLDQTSLDLTEHTPVPGTKNGLLVSDQSGRRNLLRRRCGRQRRRSRRGERQFKCSQLCHDAGGKRRMAAGNTAKPANVKNYELDVKHTIPQVAPGEVKKMSVAALVDNSVPADNIREN